MSEVAVSRHPAKTQKLVLCPYCGHAQGASQVDRCGECGGLFEPLSRRATQIAMGPWTIRDRARPFRPGCSYRVLVKMIEAGRVTPTTVLRGPTTRQFWSVARNVPGVAHLLGYCHNCGFHVDPKAKQCPQCETPFKKVRLRNELGLQFATQKEADAAQRALDRHLRRAAASMNGHASVAADLVDMPGDPAAEDAVSGGPAGSETETSAGGGDLIDDLLGDPGSTNPAMVKALDFNPSDDATRLAAAPPPPAPAPPPAPRPATEPDPPPPPAPAALSRPPTSRPNSTIWVLVALNILVVAAVLIYMLLNV